MQFHENPRTVRDPANRGAMVGAVGLLLATCAVITLPAQEQNREELVGELERIYGIDKPVERLEAFDELAVSLFGEPERAPAEEPQRGEDARDGAGGWVSWVDSDPITDEKVFFAALEAESGQNEYGRKPSLLIRRTGSTDELFVTWSDYFADERVSVTHRIGDGEPATLRWTVSTDNSATFYPGDTTSFVKKLIDAQRLVVRTSPYDSAPITAIFRLGGLPEVVSQHPDLLADWLE